MKVKLRYTRSTDRTLDLDIPTRTDDKEFPAIIVYRGFGFYRIRTEENGTVCIYHECDTVLIKSLTVSERAKKVVAAIKNLPVGCLPCEIAKLVQEAIDPLQAALEEIVAECPNPKMSYGIRVVELAQDALSGDRVIPLKHRAITILERLVNQANEEQDSEVVISASTALRSLRQGE